LLTIPCASAKLVPHDNKYDDEDLFPGDIDKCYSDPTKIWNLYKWVPEGYYGVTFTNNIFTGERFVEINGVRLSDTHRWNSYILLIPNRVEKFTVTMGGSWSGSETFDVCLKHRTNNRIYCIQAWGGCLTWDVVGGYATGKRPEIDRTWILHGDACGKTHTPTHRYCQSGCSHPDEIYFRGISQYGIPTDAYKLVNGKPVRYEYPWTPPTIPSRYYDDNDLFPDDIDRYYTNPLEIWNTKNWVPEGYYGVGITSNIGASGKFIDINGVRLPELSSENSCLLLIPQTISKITVTMGGSGAGSETFDVWLGQRTNNRIYCVEARGCVRTWDVVGRYATEGHHDYLDGKGPTHRYCQSGCSHPDYARFYGYFTGFKYYNTPKCSTPKVVYKLENNKPVRYEYPDPKPTT
jgi:hypothetical protein